jgi:hypothetical protein
MVLESRTSPALLNGTQQPTKYPKKLGRQSTDTGQIVVTTHKARKAEEGGGRRAVTVGGVLLYQLPQTFWFDLRASFLIIYSNSAGSVRGSDKIRI